MNKYKDTYPRRIKTKPGDVKSSAYINFNTEIKKKVVNSKFLVVLEYQDMKIFLQMAMFQVDLKKSL